MTHLPLHTEYAAKYRQILDRLELGRGGLLHCLNAQIPFHFPCSLLLEAFVNGKLD